MDYCKEYERRSQDALGYQQNYGTNFEYDQQNRVTKITDPEGNIRTMAYDGLGRVASEICPLTVPNRRQPSWFPHTHRMS